MTPPPTHAPPPAVSVLLPVYNAARYVTAAVQSVLAQTFGDFELIAIDDGSTDGSSAMLRAAAARDARICLVTRPNRGLVPSLNEGLALARAPLVARMDADDIALPHRLARQVAFMNSRPDIVCLGTAFEIIDAAGRRLARRVPPADDIAIEESNLRGHNAIAHPTALYRRDAVLAAGGYREAYMCAEDLDLWLRLGERGPLANLPEVLLQYRMHEASVSETRAGLQRQRMHAACRDACARRGVDVPFEMLEWRAGPTRVSRHQFVVDFGWSAYMLGERHTARVYGARAVSLRPFCAKGWRLLLTAALKPPPASAT